MIWKIPAVLSLCIAIFLGYVATRDGKFNYERSGVITAKPETIFSYLNDFHRGEVWSPYRKLDPGMKVTFSGAPTGVGSIMEFESAKAGSGRLEILKIVPNESVDIKLTMTKPFAAENLVRYWLTPEEGGTRFHWSMSGDSGFMGKLIATLVDCESMVAGEFSNGIDNLRNIIQDSGK